MSEAQRRTVSQYLEQMGRGTISAELLSPDFSVWTANSGDLSGAAYLARLNLFGGLFNEPLRLTITGLTTEGDRVAAEAESFGVLKNGVEYRNRYHFLFVFADDRIRQFREYTDTKRVIDLVRPLMEVAAKGRD